MTGIIYDKFGVWVMRPDPEDLDSAEINPCADPNFKVPLTVGQSVDGMPVVETRIYTIREILTRVKKADQLRAARKARNQHEP